MSLGENLLLGLWRTLGFRSRTVATSVGTVHALVGEGRGPLAPIVLVHGLSSAAVDYAALAFHLRRRTRRLVVIDLPGHGWSDVPRGGMRAAGIRAALLESLDELVSEPAIVFGNSLGGLVALRYAIERPDRVSHLVLASPAGAPDDLESVIRAFQPTSNREAADLLRRVLARPGIRPWLLAPGFRRRVRRRPVQELLTGLNAAELLTPHELGRIASPTLLLWGAQDRVLPPSHLAYFRAFLPPHALVEVPEHHGHAPFLDDPAGVAERIAAFAGRSLLTG